MPYEYLHGVETEIAKLKDFPVKVEANVIRGAVRAAAAFMGKVVAPLIPRRTGALAATLRVSTRVTKGAAVAKLKVGNAKKGVFYAGMVMGGTKPHLIQSKTGGGLSFGGLVRRTVRHPGAKAQPFMNEGDAAGRDGALKAAFDYADDRTRQLIASQGNGPT